MASPHAARPRLVVDNSSSDRFTSRSRAKRMLELIADMGMDADQFADAFHELIGCTNKKSAATALNRESLETYYISQFAREFGINLAYLLGENDDKDNGYDPHGKYADKRKIAELERRLA